MIFYIYFNEDVYKVSQRMNNFEGDSNEKQSKTNIKDKTSFQAKKRQIEWCIIAAIN